MKHLLIAFCLVGLCAVTSGCKDHQTKKAPESPEEKASNRQPASGNIPTGDNSQVSLDWPGSYQGLIPCADCPGIKVKLSLRSDGSYWRSMTYLDKDPQPFVEEGRFEWNDNGSAVTLFLEKGGRQMYQVGEEMLFHLDTEGKRIEGDLADRYRLLKYYPDEDLEDQRWLIVELMANPVSKENGMKQGFLSFNSQEGKLFGNNGCNIIRSDYTLGRQQGLSLGMVASTLMACPNMTLADNFNKMLGEVKRYGIRGDTLWLYGSETAPIAGFIRDIKTSKNHE